MITQTHTTGDGSAVLFQDRKEFHWSAKAHPRDILLLTQVDDPASMREEIAIAIRLGQGLPEVGVAKGLIHE